jgi:hypothetical protein
VADFLTALVSGGAGLFGAVIGAASAQIAARKSRESDRRKRCVDRVLVAITELDKAYATYATSASSERDEPRVALPLQGALRAYDQAVQMLHILWLRNAAARYRDRLTEFYLMYGQPRDVLDADRDVPTLQQLNDEHFELSAKLRNYERT